MIKNFSIACTKKELATQLIMIECLQKLEAIKDKQAKLIKIMKQ